MNPGLKGTSKLYKLNPKANTLYLSIPAEIIKEEGFPFQEGETVKTDEIIAEINEAAIYGTK